MKQWRCEAGHITKCEDEPRECTHGKLGFVMRAPDALVVPPTCGKPVRPYLAGTVHTPRPIGRPRRCMIWGRDAPQDYCDDCWSMLNGGLDE